ncbi:unnamed protein product, partial [Amoebophrya sp. A120]
DHVAEQRFAGATQAGAAGNTMMFPVRKTSRAASVIDAEVIQKYIDVIDNKVIISLLEPEYFVSLVWSMAQFAKCQKIKNGDSFATPVSSSSSSTSSTIVLPPRLVDEILSLAPKLLYTTSSGGESNIFDGKANHLPILFEGLVELVGPEMARSEVKREEQAMQMRKEQDLERERV